MAQMDPPDYHKMWLSAEDRLMVGGTKMIALQDELDIMRADLHLARDQRDAAVARADRAEALLREARPYVDVELDDRIRAHLSARSPKPGGA